MCSSDLFPSHDKVEKTVEALKRRFKVIHLPFKMDFDSGFELGLKEKPLKEKPIDSDSLSREGSDCVNYFQHLFKNWCVAGHALRDFVCHFIHGLIPRIKIRHHELTGKG